MKDAVRGAGGDDGLDRCNVQGLDGVFVGVRRKGFFWDVWDYCEEETRLEGIFHLGARNWEEKTRRTDASA